MNTFYKLCISFFVVVLIVCTVVSPNLAEGRYNPAPESLSFPKLGPILNIWDDAKENLNWTGVYNRNYDEYLSIWSIKQDEWSTDLWARRIGRDGSLYPHFAIAVSAGKKLMYSTAAYATKHDRYFVVFHESDGSDPSNMNLSAVMFDYNGGNLSSFLTVDDSATHVWGSPSVAYNEQDDEFLVVYDKAIGGCMQVLARRFDAQTGLPVAAPQLIGACDSDTDRYIPSVAYNRQHNNYLIAFDYRRFWLGEEYAHAVIASNTLSAFSPEYRLSENGIGQGDLHVAAGQDGYLVVWSAYPYQVYARRVNPDGLPVLPDEAFTISPISSQIYFVNVAATSLGYWVVWSNKPTADPEIISCLRKFHPG